MAEQENKNQSEALRRAQMQKRPFNLVNDGAEPAETPEDDAGLKRPVRVEHTSEKEHPPGKE
jgi:hypothetical protein